MENISGGLVRLKLMVVIIFLILFVIIFKLFGFLMNQFYKKHNEISLDLSQKCPSGYGLYCIYSVSRNTV